MWFTSDRLPPEPWASFLNFLDQNLSQKAQLHCLGGFALIHLYNAPRVTEDLDVVEVLPDSAVHPLLVAGGKDSEAAKKYRVYLDYVRVATYPEDYEQRLVPMYAGSFRNLQLFAVDPYDLALCKIERNSRKDREDVKYLAKAIPLDPGILRERYERELRPNLLSTRDPDLTLKLWIEMIEEERARRS